METISLDKPISYYRKAFRSHMGKCLRESNNKRLWIEIPKCASKSVSRVLLNNQWRDDNWLGNKKLKAYSAVAIFRDPLDRWIGSTLELCYHHLEHNSFDVTDFYKWFENQDFYNFDRNLDLHHLEQHKFLIDFPLKNITIINLADYLFSKKVKKHLGIHELPRLNESKNNEFKKQVKNYILDLLDNTDLRDKIREFYKIDYEILSRIEKI